VVLAYDTGLEIGASRAMERLCAYYVFAFLNIHELGCVRVCFWARALENQKDQNMLGLISMPIYRREFLQSANWLDEGFW